MDLGSAVLSAELALDLLDDPAVRDRVTLSPGADRRGAGRRRRRRCGRSQPGGGRGRGARRADGQGRAPVDADRGRRRAARAAAAEEVVGVFTVENPHGLHARPAARLVSEVRALDATVQLRNLTTGAGPVPAGSLSRVATLGALHGPRGRGPRLRAAGPGGGRAPPRAGAAPVRRGRSTTVVERPALPAPTDPAQRPAAGVAGHRDRPGPPAHRRAGRPSTRHPVGRAGRGVAAHRRGGGRRAPGDRARPGPHRARGRRRARRASSTRTCRCSPTPRCSPTSRPASAPASGPSAAWAGCLAEVEREWAGLPDPYLRERAADVHAVGDQVLRALTGADRPADDGAGRPGGRDLTPAETAGLDLDLVTGVVLAAGQPDLARRDPGPGSRHPGGRGGRAATC